MKLFRAGSLIDLDVVSQKKLVLVGGGSLGSLTMANLAYPWNQIVLIDPETLEPDNVERHLLSLTDIGRPKVEGIKKYLIGRGIPEIQIIAHCGYAQDILYDHSDAHLGIVTVDNHKAKTFVDTWARNSNIPLIFGGIYPMGTGGNTVVLPSPRDICYGCVANVFGEDAYRGSQHTDYGISIDQLLDSEGNIHKVPSLRAPISAIAADLAVEALGLLKGGEVEAQILYRAIEWETLLALGAGDSWVKNVVNYIISHAAMGLLPHMRAVMDGGRLNVQYRRSSVPVRLTQWDACPNHRQAMSHTLEDI